MRILLLLPVCLLAGTRVYELHERLSVDWQGQFVTWDFAAEEGACHPQSVRLAGPDGPLPVQLLDVETWNDTPFVRHATVATIVDLPAGAHKRYELHYGTEPVAMPAGPPLTVVPIPEGVEIDTGELALRLRLGEADGPAPAPLGGMRQRNGPWFGDSRLYGSTPVVAWRSAVEAVGPVLARVRWRYEFANDTIMVIQVDMVAGSPEATWDMRVVSTDTPDFEALLRGPDFHVGEVAAESEPTCGWLLDLGAGVDGLRLLAPWEHGQLRWGSEEERLPLVDPTAEPTGTVLTLAPWDGWWDQEVQQAIHSYTADGERLVSLYGIDPGKWIEPAAPGTWVSYRTPRMRQQWVPVEHREDGVVVMRFRAVPGQRRWVTAPTPPVAQAGDRLPGRRVWPLNRVKDMVLAWEGDAGSHPRLFVTAADIAERRGRGVDPERLAYLRDRGKDHTGTPSWRDPPALTAWLLTGDPELADELYLLRRLHNFLDHFGRFDVMRDAAQVACFYDILIDSELVDADRRAIFQARLAYLGYFLASAENWSMERGYASGNLNMSVAHVLNLGLLAACIPEHPMARQWSVSAMALLEKWLSENVGPDGEFLGAGESLGNYAYVSVSMLLVYAIAVDNAGFGDYAEDPRLRRLMLHLAKVFTPLDPRLMYSREEPTIGTPPVGRGPSHTVPGLSGLMARFTADIDPEYSAVQQWHWLRTGRSTGYVGDRMGGIENVYMDPALPARNPGWGSETIDYYGAILRQGTGTDNEWYGFFLLAPRRRLVYQAECGALASLYAYGVPISERFGLHGYQEREGLFISRVLPARTVDDARGRRRHWDIEGPMELATASLLPRQDYLDATLTMNKWDGGSSADLWEPIPAWPPAPGEAELPVAWRRQLLFVRPAEPTGAGYFVFRDTVTGGQPTVWQMWTVSEKLGTPDEIRDMESPGKTLVDARGLDGDRFVAVGQLGVDVDYYVAAPTETPRYTLRHGGKYYHYYEQYMDLLRLELPADGGYFVAMCPRPADRPAPSFATRGDGNVILIRGPWGEDAVFLAAEETTATVGKLHVEGTAASVQWRAGTPVLSLGAPGNVTFGDWALNADGPCSLLPDRIDLPAAHKGTTIRYRLPGGDWRQGEVPAGTTRVNLRNQGVGDR